MVDKSTGCPLPLRRFLSEVRGEVEHVRIARLDG
jgi:hypothetical protein